MRAIASGFSKWVLSYVAVIFVIMIMPVFLITTDVSTLDNLVNYIFGEQTIRMNRMNEKVGKSNMYHNRTECPLALIRKHVTNIRFLFIVP